MPQHHRQTVRIRKNLQAFAKQLDEPLPQVLDDITSDKPIHPGGPKLIDCFLARYPLSQREAMRSVVLAVAHEFRVEAVRSYYKTQRPSGSIA